MLTRQSIVPSDRGRVVTGHPTDSTHRDLLLREATDQFNLSLLQTRIVEGSIFRFDEISPAMLTEVLLVPGSISAVLDKILPLFGQKIIACRVLAGHRTVTTMARHGGEYAPEIIKRGE